MIFLKRSLKIGVKVTVTQKYHTKCMILRKGFHFKMASSMWLSKRIRLIVFFLKKTSYKMCSDAWRSATECLNLMVKWSLSRTVNKKIDASFIEIGFLLSVLKFFLYPTKKQIKLKFSFSCSAKIKAEMQLKMKIRSFYHSISFSFSFSSNVMDHYHIKIE